MFSKQEIIARRVREIQNAVARGEEPPKAGTNLALLILSSALYDKKQWSGDDYSEHPLKVGFDGTNSTTKQIIGILHDVVEDSDWTLDDLRTCGFSERIINGVDSVTKRKNEKYFDFVERCSLNPDGIDVKLNDLRHNSTVSRNTTLMTARQKEKLDIYIVSYQYLVAVKQKEIAAGTPITDFLANRPTLQLSPAILQKYSSRTPGNFSALQPANP